jgi:hypothetical protein
LLNRQTATASPGNHPQPAGFWIFRTIFLEDYLRPKPPRCPEFCHLLKQVSENIEIE